MEEIEGKFQFLGHLFCDWYHQNKEKLNGAEVPFLNAHGNQGRANYYFYSENFASRGNGHFDHVKDQAFELLKGNSEEGWIAKDDSSERLD